MEKGQRGAGIALLTVAVFGAGALLTKLAQVMCQTRTHCDAWRARPRQEDKDFVRVCGVPPNSESAKLALSVRMSLGNAAGVPPETIHADDWMRDRIWDSIDMLDIHFRIEKAANVKVVSRWVNESLGEMRDCSEFKVSDCVRVILASTVPADKPLLQGVYYGTNCNPVGTEIRRPGASVSAPAVD
jgi:hypothetical protein